MTKFNDKLVELLKTWFETKKPLTIDDYEMLKKLAYEMLK